MEAFLTPYPTFVLILALSWFVLFLSNVELRRELIVLGVLALFLLPLTFTIHADETATQALFNALTFLDLIFVFTVAGIAGTIFHAMLGKHYHSIPVVKGKRSKDQHLAQWWLLRLFFAVLFFLWGVMLLVFGFDLSLAKAVLVAAIMIAIYMVSHRHDLLLDSIVSGFLTMFIVFLAATLGSWFSADPIDIGLITSSGAIAGVPTDLLLWSLGLGIVLGPLYEYVRRVELK